MAPTAKCSLFPALHQRYVTMAMAPQPWRGRGSFSVRLLLEKYIYF